MQNRSVILLVIIVLTMIIVGWIVQLAGGVRQPHSWRATVALANSPPAPIARAWTSANAKARELGWIV